MAGTKRSAGSSSAPVAGNKRRASSGQGVLPDFFGASKASGGGEQGGSGSKGKGRKSAARQVTPDDSDDDGDRQRTPDLSTPSKHFATSVDPTTAYPTPSKTPAKNSAKAALIKEAAKDVGVVRLDEDDEPEVQVVEQKQAVGPKAKAVIVEKGSGEVKQPEKLMVKDKRWNQAYANAREAMGGQDPIHGEDQNRIDQILRVFDMTDDYGPCIGMTRLQRWQRAEDLGLEPPEDVRAILLTQEGLDDERYRENVFHPYLEKVR